LLPSLGKRLSVLIPLTAVFKTLAGGRYLDICLIECPPFFQGPCRLRSLTKQNRLELTMHARLVVYESRSVAKRGLVSLAGRRTWFASTLTPLRRSKVLYWWESPLLISCRLELVMQQCRTNVGDTTDKMFGLMEDLEASQEQVHHRISPRRFSETSANPASPQTTCPATSVDRNISTKTTSNTKSGSSVKARLQSEPTTPAHKLLDVSPVMREWCQGIPYLQRLIGNGQSVSEYAMQLEKDRGTLRLWGIGEELDPSDDEEYSDSPGKDDKPKLTSLADTEILLTDLPPLRKVTPGHTHTNMPRVRYDHPGGLRPNG
jgi:hypothetical protein